ncbi:MAG: serine/threonine-protein phosphatase [Oscillospiraceae bacterium]|nr:serine/threonine-protein phosphatase [Oscillospiraceae bacterium]
MFFLKKRKNIADSAPVLIGNMHHIGARESQQDSFAISDVSNMELLRRKGVFGVVADGMGGLADGGEVSGIVARAMLQYFIETDTSGRPELDLLNMLYLANDNVNRFLDGREQGGSTVVATILCDGKMYWVAVGDSRICLLRGGALIQLNREHVYAVELYEKAATGEITWEDAATSPEQGALTSYLGMGNLEKVDRNIMPVQLVSGDRILLMSDGVFGVLTNDEILESMMTEPHRSAGVLQEKVLEKQNPNQDNLTAVILEYRGI